MIHQQGNGNLRRFPTRIQQNDRFHMICLTFFVELSMVSLQIVELLLTVTVIIYGLIMIIII